MQQEFPGGKRDNFVNKEHKTGKPVLFPVKLDNTVEETEEAWAATIHSTRHIGDFTRWKEHDEYQKGSVGCFVTSSKRHYMIQ